MFRKRYCGNRDEKMVENPCKLLETLVLPNAKLQFCPEQLQNLNFIIQKKLQAEKTNELDRTLILARSVTERLVQRLVCCVGKFDERFSSKFLLTNDYSHKNPNKLQYLVRIDKLSMPQLYKDDKPPKFNVIENDPDYPPGYARIRLHTTTLKLWQDCCNPSGYLRRDKVQTRFIELLSKAVKTDQLQTPLDVDEAKYCGCPGKIITPYILHRLLRIDSRQQVFYGPNGSLPRFPDPRDFQIAIIDDFDGIKLNVEFLSPTLNNLKIIVRLLLCIGLDNWPSSADFPKRINLTHTDSLLYYRSAQCGVFLVGYGVQSSGWQLRLPATEEVIYHHYNENSTIWCIYDYLNYSLIGINQRRTLQKSYKILNRYIMFTLLLKQLEEDSQFALDDLIKWSPLYLSHHVLVVFDRLIGALLAQNLPNYFFTSTNLLVNPGHLCEDDYLLEAQLIQKFLLNLFDESLIPLRTTHDFQQYQIGLDSETILLRQFRELIDNFLPKSHNFQHRRRFRFFLPSGDCNYVEFSQRQLAYLSLVFVDLLNYRRKILINDPLLLDDRDDFGNLEDFVFLLVLVLEQAKDEILKGPVKNPIKFRLKFNGIVAKFIENLRKHPELLLQIDFDNNQILVENLLRCLCRLVEKLPVLTKFLKRIFEVSYINSWYLESIQQTPINDELTTLCSVIEMINSKQTTPAIAIMDAKNKNWIWASSILDLVDLNTLRLIFIDDKQQVYRHILSLPSYQDRHRDYNQRQYQMLSPSSSSTITTINRNYFTTILRKNPKDEAINLPFYEILKNSSPLTRILNETHRHGDHRCYGDILKLLQSMQKLSMFEQAVSNLPEDQRKEIYELINSMRTIRTKRTIKKWSNTLPSSSLMKTTGRSKRSRSIPAKIERYTPKHEGTPIADKTIKTTEDVDKRTVALIKICRIARIREDSNVLLFQNPLKTKSLLTKSQSFKI